MYKMGDLLNFPIMDNHSKFFFNSALNKLLSEKNLSKTNLVQKTGLSYPYISAICNLKKSLGARSFLNILMKAFDMSKEDGKEFLWPLMKDRCHEEWKSL